MHQHGLQRVRITDAAFVVVEGVRCRVRIDEHLVGSDRRRSIDPYDADFFRSCEHYGDIAARVDCEIRDRPTRRRIVGAHGMAICLQDRQSPLRTGLEDRGEALLKKRDDTASGADLGDGVAGNHEIDGLDRRRGLNFPFDPTTTAAADKKTQRRYAEHVAQPTRGMERSQHSHSPLLSLSSALVQRKPGKLRLFTKA